jgi:hypothetical protein
VGGWSACSGEGVCSVGETEQGSCSLGQTGVKTRTCTSSCAWSAWDTSSCQDTCSISNDEDRHCEDPQGSYTERGTWNNSNCTCSCPSGSSLNQDGECYLTLGSKETWGFKQEHWPLIDENTRLRMEEGPEYETPHFYADYDLIKELFKDFKIVFINHIEDFYDNKGTTYSSFHYHILIKKV